MVYVITQKKPREQIRLLLPYEQISGIIEAL